MEQSKKELWLSKMKSGKLAIMHKIFNLNPYDYVKL